jgi:4-aminobutyrate aminotransferase
MISEAKLAKLSYTGAPKIITLSVPGPKGRKLLSEAAGNESMTRGGGLNSLVFDEGYGVTVKDPDGNLYIDITAGVAVNSVGRRNPRVTAAIERQLKGLMHASDISNTRRTELALKVNSVMPANLRNRCLTYFAQSGSGAVETAIKFARRVTGKSQIIAFHGAYHGVWCGTAALTTGYKYRHGWGPLIPGVIHVPYAYCYRCCFGLKYPACGVQCGKYVDYVLNTPYTAADDVAAVIIEAQQGEGGYVVPPPEFFRMVERACRKYGCLYIDDEVQAGAGRSGKMWAIEHTGVKPDMLAWGKGMGGDMPMAGVSFRNDFADKFIEGSQPNTFAGNALTAVVCMTNIDIITDKEDGLIGRAAELGGETIIRLQKAAGKSRVIGDVRGRGFMIGVELVKNKKTKEPFDEITINSVCSKLLNKGVIMVPCGRYGNVLRLMPSLTITRAYLDKAVDILLDVIGKVEACMHNK